MGRGGDRDAGICGRQVFIEANLRRRTISKTLPPRVIFSTAASSRRAVK
jgi:hypothetical protein